MTKRAQPRPASLPLPLMMAELALASWETIGRRTLMMAQGTCSPAEYYRMVMEKAVACQRSAAVLAQPWVTLDMADVVAPWHRGATVNARRLRRK